MRNGDHQLCNQDQSDKVQVTVTDTHIHQRLCQKWEDKLQQARCQHSQNQLNQLFTIRRQIFKKETKTATAGLFLVPLPLEFRARFKRKCSSFLFSIHLSRQPTLFKFFLTVRNQLTCRISDIETVATALLLYIITDHKVVLVPMQDARQRYVLFQLLQRDTDPRSTETDGFRRITDAQHGNSFTGNKRTCTEGLQGVSLTIVLRNHAKAGRAAIHSVQLEVMRERT